MWSYAQATLDARRHLFDRSNVMTVCPVVDNGRQLHRLILFGGELSTPHAAHYPLSLLMTA